MKISAIIVALLPLRNCHLTRRVRWVNGYRKKNHFLEMQYVARLGIAGVRIHIPTWYIVIISFMYPYESALFYTERRIAIEIYLKTAVM